MWLCTTQNCSCLVGANLEVLFCLVSCDKLVWHEASLHKASLDAQVYSWPTNEFPFMAKPHQCPCEFFFLSSSFTYLCCHKSMGMLIPPNGLKGCVLCVLAWTKSASTDIECCCPKFYYSIYRGLARICGWKWSNKTRCGVDEMAFVALSWSRSIGLPLYPAGNYWHASGKIVC